MISRIDGCEAAAMLNTELTNAASAIRSIAQPTASREYACRTMKQEAHPSRVGCSEINVQDPQLMGSLL
jgi:adenylosuccinate lyase